MAVESGIAGVLVTYSPALAAQAIPRFLKLMAEIAPGAPVVIINNHPTAEVKAPPAVPQLRGSNRWMEFGGWQEGLEYLRGLKGWESLKSVVFANDTFCAHRPMGLLEEFSFRQAVKKSAGSRAAAAAGYLSRAGRPFRLGEVVMSEWICTYLFSLNRAALDALNWELHLANGIPEEWLRGGGEAETFFGPGLDHELAVHLRAWLFEPARASAWYQAAPLTEENSAMFERKARSILFEKHLSARLASVRAQIFSCNDLFVARVFRRAMRFLERK